MAEPCQQAFTVVDGDTLSGISVQAYGKTVWEVNRYAFECAGGDDSTLVDDAGNPTDEALDRELEPGMVLVFPAPGTVTATAAEGDTLRHLIARWMWPHLYMANRDVVGPDADKIYPGQDLIAPVVVEAMPGGDES